MAHNKEVRFTHDFFGVISEMEVALCIDGEDYSTRDIDMSMSKIKQRLQRQYSIDLSGTMTETYAGTIIGDEVKNFLDNMQFMYNRVCGCSHYFRYVGQVPINLSKINYLGITKESMLSVLKLLQCEGRQDSLSSAMDQIKSKIGTIPMSNEKKLYMILYVSYKMELFELSAAVAEILYLGGI
jgi:hypothetical protein